MLQAGQPLVSAADPEALPAPLRLAACRGGSYRVSLQDTPARTWGFALRLGCRVSMGRDRVLCPLLAAVLKPCAAYPGAPPRGGVRVGPGSQGPRSSSGCSACFDRFGG